MIWNVLLLVNLTQTCEATRTVSEWKLRKTCSQFLPPCIASVGHSDIGNRNKNQLTEHGNTVSTQSYSETMICHLSNLQSHIHISPLSLKSLPQEQSSSTLTNLAFSIPEDSAVIYRLMNHGKLKMVTNILAIISLINVIYVTCIWIWVGFNDCLNQMNLMEVILLATNRFHF